MVTAYGVAKVPKKGNAVATKAVAKPEALSKPKNICAVDIDKRLGQTLHFVRPKDPAAERSMQRLFLAQKKQASTVIWSSVAFILTLRLVFFIDTLAMIGIIGAFAVFGWHKYRQFCKCPNCTVSLVPGNNTWRTPRAGFASAACPRCDTPLAISESDKRKRI